MCVFSTKWHNRGCSDQGQRLILGESRRGAGWKHQTVSPALQATSDLGPSGVRDLSRYLNLSAGFWPSLPFSLPHLTLPTQPCSPPIIPSKSIITVLSIIHNINIHSMAQRMDGEDIGGPSFQYRSPLEGVDKRGGDGVMASSQLEVEPH